MRKIKSLGSGRNVGETAGRKGGGGGGGGFFM